MRAYVIVLLEYPAAYVIVLLEYAADYLSGDDISTHARTDTHTHAHTHTQTRTHTRTHTHAQVKDSLRLALPAESSLLDIGCGRGRIAHHFATMTGTHWVLKGALRGTQGTHRGTGGGTHRILWGYSTSAAAAGGLHVCCVCMCV